MPSNKYYFIIPLLFHVEEVIAQITIVRGTLSAQHARNMVHAQCGTYASHFVAGTYVGGICLALCTRQLVYIYIYKARFSPSRMQTSQRAGDMRRI